MRPLFLLLFLLVGIFAGGSRGYGSTLPVVGPEHFSPGQYWIWIYYEKGNFDSPYAFEKYTVEKMDRAGITLILSSKFKREDAFSPRQKFVVDLKKCLTAYQQRNMRKNWSLQTYYFSEGKWVSLGTTSKTDIFEEKFNCNPHEYGPSDGPRFRTKNSSFEHPRLGEILAFQQTERTSHRDLSWFLQNQGKLSGVAFLKDFNPNTSHFYVMRFEDGGIENIVQ